MDHAYNRPKISALEFLTAIFHDQTLDLSIRMEAAHALLPYEAPPLPFDQRAAEDKLTYRIGGFPDVPGNA